MIGSWNPFIQLLEKKNKKFGKTGAQRPPFSIIIKT